MRFSPGDSFDRYAIEALLGEGGMGEVYRAEDTRLGRKVALKVLRTDDQGDSETWQRAVTRMQREARAVAALSHPSIVAVYDVGEHEGTPFIAMELAQGKPLRELVGKDLPLSTRLGILIDIAKALSAAHHAGLVHRDVKPENVMVQDNNLVKVLDFGIARRTAQVFDPHAPTQDGALATMTEEGAFLGTPAYMAPEQLRGEKIDPRADQFAFGVLAFELLSCKLPFRTDKGAVSLMASILSDPAPPLEGAGENLAEIVARTLEKAAEDRFDSMDDVVAALSSLVSNEAPRMAMKTPPSRRATYTAVTGGARSGHSNAAPPERRSRLLFLAAPLVLLAAAPLGWFVVKNESPAADANAALASAPSTNAAPAVVPTAVTELPIPASDSAEAKLAFREGVQAVRDATWDTAALAFDRARKADPAMAAAHLRYTMYGMWTDFAAAQEAFRKALFLRSSMSERDQLFLDAFAPIIQSVPPDHVASQRKFEALAARYPGDAEIVFWNLRTLMRADASKEALLRSVSIADRCVALDPKYADCWQTKENVLMLLDRQDEALAALEKCIEVSPAASDCLGDKIQIAARRADCPTLADTARRWITKEPANPRPYVELAGALYHTGESEAAVRVAIEQASNRYRALGRSFQAQEMEAWSAMAFGDLPGAMKAVDALASDPAGPPPQAQASLYWIRTWLRIEMGRIDEVGRLADEYIAGNALRPAVSERSHQADPTVFFHAAALRAGKASKENLDEARLRWLTRQPSAVTPMDRFFVWRDAYAIPAFIGAPADIAIEKEPELASLAAGGVKALDPPAAALYGYVRGAAGRHAEALPFLERGASICRGIDDAIWHQRVVHALGAAREALGDEKGACEAYGRVLSRWGKASDSVTVKDIRKRMKALSCDAPQPRGL